MDDLTPQEINEIKENLANNSDLLNLRASIEAIGNVDRFAIVNLLKKRSYTITELEGALNKSQSTISHHIKILQQQNLIMGIKQGKFTEYELVKDSFKRMNSSLIEWFSAISNW
ncbi:hypothetical protein NEF87_003934 [Candidatus Lokiarchaeum ossiferum]|uniref:HTH arsR-type domain-containing protein n=1 Tax=Candidatus Lokiarchaeum ossiferum TaxID=2951803 RepID=A0ABY6HVV6_9ARCH|nr:hypothetical protein NEF87_003934 [Candidatus Lokiarchaeum sp. B-35]